MAHKFINKAQCRKFVLDRAQSTGRRQFIAVGEPFWERVNARVEQVLSDELHRHPSMGKTLK